MKFSITFEVRDWQEFDNAIQVLKENMPSSHGASMIPVDQDMYLEPNCRFDLQLNRHE